VGVFVDLGPNLQSDIPFKHRKFKRPAKGRGPPGPLNLEAMILSNERDLNRRQECSPIGKKNLSRGETPAWKNLGQNKEIVLFPADKGNALVIQNRADYLKEGNRQLSDKGSYRELTKDPTEEYRGEVQNAIEDMYQSGEIDETVKKYLFDPVNRTSRMYFLPKIHKEKKTLSGRPVVSGNGCQTEKISQFVDHFLNPTTKKIKSYVKDTTHFIPKFEGVGTLPEGALIVTLDIEGLYPNIPTQKVYKQ
jgi:hypothetical protein